MTPEMRSRFLTEARAAARLDHPNVVPVYEAGEIGSISYIASAFCEGTTLAGWLRARTEPVPPRLAARLIATLADAVQHAHDRGILHRDLKPGNILLQATARSRPDPNPEHDGLDAIPRITDFGLAKILDEAGCETRSGLPIGSLSYMAPEQAEGRSSAMGPATDVYALGTILYELLVDRTPFRGQSVLETLEQVRSIEPVPPSRLRAKLPRDIERICLKCLRKDPVGRYAGAGALSEDLSRFTSGRPVFARPAAPWAIWSNWALRPERVRDAGLLMIGVAALGFAWFVNSIAFIHLGIVTHPPRPLEFYQQVFAVILTDFAPASWLGWRMTEGRRWAIWAAEFVVVINLIVQVGCLQGLPPRFGGFYDDQSLRVPIYSMLIMFGIWNVIFNLIALRASSATRSRNGRSSGALGR